MKLYHIEMLVKTGVWTSEMQEYHVIAYSEKQALKKIQAAYDLPEWGIENLFIEQISRGVKKL